MPAQETDPIINTMPITCWDRAKQKAKQLMELGFPQDPPRGYLFGASTYDAVPGGFVLLLGYHDNHMPLAAQTKHSTCFCHY